MPNFYTPGTYPQVDPALTTRFLANNVDPGQTVNIDTGETNVATSQGLLFALMQLGYICQTWEKICLPWQPFEVDTRDAEGEGYLDFSSSQTGWQCSGASIEITHLPADVDIGYGQSQLIHAGWCSFVRNVGGGGITVNLGNPFRPPDSAPDPSFDRTFVFKLGIGNDNLYHEELCWLNFNKTIWTPKTPNVTGFWYKLKQGVRAKITAYGMENRFAASIDTFQFNPLRGGFFNEPLG